MVGDLFRFSGIFALVSIAFAAGMYSIYHHYEGMTMMDRGVTKYQYLAFNRFVYCYVNNYLLFIYNL